MTVILGLLLSFILHALIEVFYINHLLSIGKSPQGNYFLGVGWCALPSWAQYSLPGLGIIGGYFLGVNWWKVVYIEKRHWKNRIKKK
ncbi:MAG: hypothetical protein PHQ20_02405 [Candidatus Moranbacteria bacterium]|nr:hypothetical protein [Candidatus Moranbacteria bacterium]